MNKVQRVDLPSRVAFALYLLIPIKADKSDMYLHSLSRVYLSVCEMKQPNLGTDSN